MLMLQQEHTIQGTEVIYLNILLKGGPAKL